MLVCMSYFEIVCVCCLCVLGDFINIYIDCIGFGFDLCLFLFVYRFVKGLCSYCVYLLGFIDLLISF